MWEFVALAALLVFVVTATGLLVAGVIHRVLARESAHRRRCGDLPCG
jgi:hypothetical protein